MKREEAMELVTDGFKQLSEALAQGKSDALVAMLDMVARFHSYSFGNCLLIAKQRPSATHIAGYRKWEQLGRHVIKGEKGIAILAPLVYKKQDDQSGENGRSDVSLASRDPEKEVRGFRAVHVFDVSQTEGEPLPGVAKIVGEADEWLAKLERIVRQAGIELEYADCLDGAEGLSQGGKILILAELSETQRFYVLIHEYAHEILHKCERRKKTNCKTRETEAEAVGFVVARAVGLDAQTHASDYIQLYDGDTETLQQSMHFIQKTAAKIIEALHQGDSESNSAPVPPPARVQHEVRAEV